VTVLNKEKYLKMKENKISNMQDTMLDKSQ